MFSSLALSFASVRFCQRCCCWGVALLVCIETSQAGFFRWAARAVLLWCDGRGGCPNHADRFCARSETSRVCGAKKKKKNGVVPIPLCIMCSLSLTRFVGTNVKMVPILSANQADLARGLFCAASGPLVTGVSLSSRLFPSVPKLAQIVRFACVFSLRGNSSSIAYV